MKYFKLLPKYEKNLLKTIRDKLGTKRKNLFFLKKETPLKRSVYAVFRGEPSEIRTPDNLIKSQVLCQLS